MPAQSCLAFVELLAQLSPQTGLERAWGGAASGAAEEPQQPRSRSHALAPSKMTAGERRCP